MELPNNPRVDEPLGNDEAIQQDGAEQHEHAQAIGHHNVARHHRYTPEEGHSHLVGHKDDGPVNEESASAACCHINHTSPVPRIL